MAAFLILSNGDTVDSTVITNFKVNRHNISLFAASARPDSKFIHTLEEGLVATPQYVAFIIQAARTSDWACMTWKEAELAVPKPYIPVMPVVVEEVEEAVETETSAEAVSVEDKPKNYDQNERRGLL